MTVSKEIPKFVIEEMDRLHSLLTHPNSDQTMKQWAREKLDRLYNIVFGTMTVYDG